MEPLLLDAETAPIRERNRNLLGMLPVSDPASLAEEIAKRWPGSRVVAKPHGCSTSYQVEVFSGRLFDEVNALSKKPVCVGVFIETEKGNPNADVIVFYTVKDRALTRLRKRLLETAFSLPRRRLAAKATAA